MLKAKAKCARAEYTSDLNSDFEGKREKKKKRFFDENDFEDNIVEAGCSITNRHTTSVSIKERSTST